jgi:glycosyltransferase involved in cell wall biosynthesis
VIDHIGRGGAQDLLASLLENQNADKNTILLLPLYDKPQSEKIEIPASIVLLNPIISGPYNYSPQLIVGVFKFFKLVRKIRPDIVNSHLYVSWIYLAIHSLIDHKKIKYKVTIHSPRKITPYVVMFCNKISLVSRKLEFISLFYVASDELIMDGVDLKRVSTIPITLPSKDQLLIKSITQTQLPNSFSIVSMSRLHKQRRIEDLILGISKLDKACLSQVSLFIYGSGPNKNKLIKLVSKLKLDKQITFIPWANKKEVFKHRYDLAYSISCMSEIGLAGKQFLCAGIPLLVLDLGSSVRKNEKIQVPSGIYEAKSVFEIKSIIEDLILNPRLEIENLKENWDSFQDKYWKSVLN